MERGESDGFEGERAKVVARRSLKGGYLCWAWASADERGNGTTRARIAGVGEGENGLDEEIL